MRVLVTGVAGFIGFSLSARLLAEGNDVFGIDNLNSYYDTNLKHARLAQLNHEPKFIFEHLDITHRQEMASFFQSNKFDFVVHLAAQAGVRYSLENPLAYVDSNLCGFANMLEGCRHSQVSHLIFASSSSVYGANSKVPFSVTDNADNPVSFYAATKKANELMAYSYSHLYGIPITGLRFFTVYGSWGRPDMSYFKFAQAIDANIPIDIYNFGKMRRDFTHITDVIETLVRVILNPPAKKSPQKSSAIEVTEKAAPYRVYNIGNSSPVELCYFVEVLEYELGKKSIKNFKPMQPGDILVTYADISELIDDIGYKPRISIEEGLHEFVAWYRNYYN